MEKRSMEYQARSDLDGGIIRFTYLLRLRRQKDGSRQKNSVSANGNSCRRLRPSSWPEERMLRMHRRWRHDLFRI